MSIYISNANYLSDVEIALRRNRGAVGYHSHFGLGEISTTGFAPEAQYPIQNAWSPDTYTRCRWPGRFAMPSGTDTINIVFANSGAQDTDYLAIFGHNFGSLGYTLKVQESTDGGDTWDDITTPVIPPADDGPILWHYDSTDAALIRLNATVSYSGALIQRFLTHIRCGELLRLQRPRLGGTKPPLIKNSIGIDPESDKGNYFVPVITSQNMTWDINQINNTPAFVRASIVPFINHMNCIGDVDRPQGAFFYVPRPEDYPNEIAYCAKPLNQKVEPEYMASNGLMQWSCNGGAFI